MFMRIESIFVVEVPKSDGQHGSIKECRASGMIYELADIDWEETDADKQNGVNGAEADKGTGKGKAREDGRQPTVPVVLVSALRTLTWLSQHQRQCPFLRNRAARRL